MPLSWYECSKYIKPLENNLSLFYEILTFQRTKINNAYAFISLDHELYWLQAIFSNIIKANTLKELEKKTHLIGDNAL
jgi:hypothetical protein